MARIIREIITTRPRKIRKVVRVQVPVEASDMEVAVNYFYYFFGLIEILLGFRLLLKVMGASVASSFVQFIYGVTGFFILPFEGIFRKGFTEGIETTSVLEPATLVAIIVYPLLAWAIVQLILITSGESIEE